MTQAPPKQAEFKPPSKKTIGILVALVVLFLIGSSLRSIATFYTDWLLFKTLNQSDTFTSLITSQIFVPLIVLIIMLVSIYAMIAIAIKTGQKNSFLKDFDEWVVPVSQAFRKRPRPFHIVSTVLISLFFASSTFGFYQEWILFTNAKTFGVRDPLFNKDIGFFVFELPFLRLLSGWIFGAFVLLLIVSAVAHYINGSIALEKTRRHISTAAKIHLSVLCALAGLAKAAQYYFERFALVHSTRGAVDGAAYTDVMARLPANRFLIFVAIIASVLFLVNVYRKGIVLPLVAIALWMIVVLVVATIYPLIIQNFSVNPSRNTKERPYAERNIEATRAAYALNDVENEEIDFEQGITEENADEVKAALKDPLLWTEASFGPWVQQKRGEQTFAFTTADRDRYQVGDRTLPVFVAAREVVPPSQLPDRSWPSRHAVYTHGFGAAIASASQVITGNEPDYLVSELPTEGRENALESLRLNTNKARNYFGEGLEEYVFVGSAQEENTPLEEPLDVDELNGVGVGDFFKQAAFSLRFWDYNILITNVIKDDSQILYVRDPRERVKKLAPFLDVDSNPYPVVTNGEVIWVVDAYTSSDQYPYSQYLDTQRLSAGNSLRKNLNYVRNSVKATVSARTGEVNLYIVDDKDPIIKAYDSAFPDLFKAGDEAPEEIVKHYRYPEDIFDVQTFIYGDYHVTDPRVLLEGSARLQVAPSMFDQPISANTLVPAPVQGGRAERTTQTGVPLPTLYQYVAHSQMEKPEFLLTRSFVPISTTFRMDSFLSVSSDGENYGKKRVLNFKIDGDTSALSPTMMQSQIDAENEFARQKTLLDQQGAEVLLGNLQIIPVANTVVYVQPVYVKGSSEDARPVLTFVTVSVSGRTVCAPTIDQAVDALLAERSLCVPFTQNVFPTTGVIPDSTPDPDQPVIPDDQTPATTTTTTTPSTGLDGVAEQELVQRLNQAAQRYEEAKRNVDLGAMQRAAEEMVALVNELNSR